MRLALKENSLLLKLGKFARNPVLIYPVWASLSEIIINLYLSKKIPDIIT